MKQARQREHLFSSEAEKQTQIERYKIKADRAELSRRI